MTQGQTLTGINTIVNGGNRYDPSTDNPTNEHYAVLTYGNGGNVTGQLATHFQTGKLYSRGHNSSWSGWRAYWSDSDFTSTNVSNWNTAYGWGDHAQEGYLTSFDITTQTDGKYLRSDANDNFTGRLTNNSMNETPSYDKGAINLQPSASGGSIGITFRSKVNSTSDAGYIWWYDDNNHYNELDSTENGVLLIAVQNDGGATSEDAIALESSGDIYLNAGVASGDIGSGVWNSARGNVYLGYAGDRARVLSTDDGNPTQWNDAYGWGDHSLAGYTGDQDLSGYATETYVGEQIDLLVDSAPGTLDTLNELAAALGDDPNFATTITTSIATKLPLAGGIMSGNIGRSAHNKGYLVGGYNNVGASATATNPIFTIGTSYLPAVTTLGNMYGIGYTRADASFMGVASGSGWGMYVAADGDARIWLDGSTGDIAASGTLSASGYNDSNWNTAYGWGNHADEGYITSYVNTTYSAGTGIDLNGTTFRLNGGAIPTGVDLNTYRSTGIYSQNSNSQAAAGSNYPVAQAGVLEVWNDDYGNGLFTTQRYKHYNSTADYSRVYYNGSWSAWRNLAQDTDTVYTLPFADNSSNWDTAYGWGDHSSGGYLTSFDITTQTDGRYLRSDTADTFTGSITMGTQKALVANNYGRGVYGLYSASRYQHVWSMGTAYNLSDDGTSSGNLYGLAFTHTNVGGQSKSGLAHQLLIMDNGVTKSAIGRGIWTDGTITTTSHGDSSQWNAAYTYSQVGHLTSSSTLNASNMTTGTLPDVMSNSTRYNIGFIDGSSSQSRDKIRVWGDGAYSIGMKNGYDYGHLGSGEYAMSFQMDTTPGRGWWWGRSSQTDDQGVMSLTNYGRLTVATSISIGQGETVTVPSTTPLYVEGSTAGETVFEVQGTSGQLFSITDSLIGDIFEVSDISGVPIFTVNSSGVVTVDDTLHVTGDVIAYYASDRRLKDNIKPIEDSIDKIKMIGGYEFDWNSKSKNNYGHDVGVIAQEIEEVLPELVGTRSDGFKGVKYEKLTALLIQANKELIERVEELESKLKK
jgi:hypothetical protein